MNFELSESEFRVQSTEGNRDLIYDMKKNNSRLTLTNMMFTKRSDDSDKPEKTM